MNPTEETKEQFIERYVAWPNVARDFENDLIVLPCDCEDGGGPTHWAAIPPDAGLIRHHLEFQAPKDTPWPEGVPEYKGD